MHTLTQRGMILFQKFVDNFDVAKQQAMEMGSKAGELALDAAQNLHSKATRVALAITVNVGTIIMFCSVYGLRYGLNFMCHNLFS